MTEIQMIRGLKFQTVWQFEMNHEVEFTNFAILLSNKHKSKILNQKEKRSEKDVDWCGVCVSRCLLSTAKS